MKDLDAEFKKLVEFIGAGYKDIPVKRIILSSEGIKKIESFETLNGLKPVIVKSVEVRYYKGKRKCVITFKQPMMHTAGIIFENGEKAIVPIRTCWRKPRKMKESIK